MAEREDEAEGAQEDDGRGGHATWSEAEETLRIQGGHHHSARLASEAAAAQPKRSFEDMVPEPYREFEDVFSEKEAQRLPEPGPYDFKIEWKEDIQPELKTKIYPLSPLQQQDLDEWLKVHLEQGCIRPSKSPISSPVMFVPKKDGKL